MWEADPKELLTALVALMANDGCDPDEIRAAKRYIRRFVEDIAAGRETYR
jgi:hypothetical protein